VTVQRYPDPGLLPTSQEAGGSVHDNSLALGAPGSDPGFDAATMTYNVSTDAPRPPAGPDMADQWDVDPGGAHHQPHDPESGEFMTGSPWGQAGSSAGGWGRPS
jgi:hypothetical protein